jgi:hypothetical protein
MGRNRSTRRRDEINDDELFADLKIKKKSAKVTSAVSSSKKKKILQAKKSKTRSRSKKIVERNLRGKSTSSINNIKKEKSVHSVKNIPASSKSKEKLTKITKSISVDNHLPKSNKNSTNKSDEKNYTDTKINFKTKKSVKNNLKQINTKSDIDKPTNNLSESLIIDPKPSLLNSLSSNTDSASNLLGPICIRLGLCCINNYLRAKKETIFCSRSLILSTYKSKGQNRSNHTRNSKRKRYSSFTQMEPCSSHSRSSSVIRFIPSLHEYNSHS